MRVNLAWLSMTDEWARSAVALLGISASVVLVFMQLGLYSSVPRSASQVHDRLDYDLLLVSPEYVFLAKAGDFPRARLRQAAGAPDVAAVAPLYVAPRPWRNPLTGQRHRLLVMGTDPDDSAFLVPEIRRGLAWLRKPDTMLVDRRTRPEFGPQDPGTVIDLGGRHVEVVGRYTLGTGLGFYGAAVVSDLTFARLLGRAAADRVNLGLVKLKPGVAAEAAAASLAAALPGDVRVVTRASVLDSERRYWVQQTSVGLMFGSGTVVAAAVGAIFLYQVLANDIADHQSNYATLKALGYSDRSVASVVLQKGAIFALLAYVPALGVSLVLYAVTREAARMPIEMTPGRALGVLTLVLLVGSLSAFLCLGRLRAADPAELF